MNVWLFDLIKILFALTLVGVNGFFVSAEFALVKVRKSRFEEMLAAGRPFASTARWLWHRLDASLSASQLGITMASLGLGWIGEPAVAHLLRPLFLYVGIGSEMIVHGAAFALAFSFITAIHIVLGEQVPKIAAIRSPETALLWCAVPLKIFYYLTYPLLVTLSWTTSRFLGMVGIEGTSEEEIPHSQEEIQALLKQSRMHGKLSRSEHLLIDAVFRFDDLICRRVMVPRPDVVFLNTGRAQEKTIALIEKTKHSRYPVCEGSLDKVIGVVHIKDLFVKSAHGEFDIFSVMRPPQFVPETMPVRRLLRQFQSTHQHMAFPVDEYGTVLGIVTLENVLEALIGPVEDEFDDEQPDIMPEGPGQFILAGRTPVESINQRLELDLEAEGVDTISGLMILKADKFLAPGDRVELKGATAEVLEVKGQRITSIRLTLPAAPPKEPGS